MNYALENNSHTHSRKPLHSAQMALWLAIASMVMIFAAFTSAYIIKRADTATWLSFKLPSVFYLSTLAIALSSIAMFLAVKAFKKEDYNRYRLMLSIMTVLGLGFMALQFMGWQWLYNHGVYVATNPSSSFLYLITGVHVAHVLAGIIALVVTTLRAYRKAPDALEILKDGLKNVNRATRLQLMATYWHFVDILWIYLFLFFLITQ